MCQETEKALMNYDWPGNVRELENLIERAVALAENNAPITVDALPLENISCPKVTQSLKEAQASFEKQYIQRALIASEGNQTKAAKLLGIHRTTLIAKMSQFGLKP